MDNYSRKLYPFKHRRLEIEGHSIHYIDEGEGPVVLFSHAPLGSSFMYRNLIKPLSEQFRCIALDYPGFGLSRASDDYTFDITSQSYILKTFISRLNLSDIIVLGHDTGGPSALMVAADQPHLFAGFILTATTVFPVSEYRAISRMLGLVNSTPFRFLNARTNFLIRSTVAFGIHRRKLSFGEKKEYYRMFDTPEKRNRITDLLYSLKTEEKTMRHVGKAFEDSLKNKPMLLIYGDKDPVYKLGVPGRITEMAPNSHLHIIQGERHFPVEGVPFEMSSIIKNWIERSSI